MFRPTDADRRPRRQFARDRRHREGDVHPGARATTLPSRIGRLRPTVDSLLAQTVPPDRIFVCVPRRSVREDCAYELPGWLKEPPPGLQLVRCERDDGPATKLLGSLPHIPAEACLIVVDDDMVYRPFLVERLAKAQLARRDASFSFHVERVGRLRRKGTRFLLGSGLLGPRLRLLVRLTFAERALTFPWRRLRSAASARGILPG